VIPVPKVIAVTVIPVTPSYATMLEKSTLVGVILIDTGLFTRFVITVVLFPTPVDPIEPFAVPGVVRQ
jgi:hypothetical protein